MAGALPPQLQGRGIAVSLGLDADHFVQRCERPLSRASYVFYPPQPEHSTDFGVAPHTDFGTLTVLCQDDIGGLEIENAGGDWVPAAPIEGTLIVNVGDLLARWTGGAFRSASHRVINRSSRPRLSLVSGVGEIADPGHGLDGASKSFELADQAVAGFPNDEIMTAASQFASQVRPEMHGGIGHDCDAFRHGWSTSSPRPSRMTARSLLCTSCASTIPRSRRLMSSSWLLPRNPLAFVG